ncbi:MAG TPA: NADH-quinone oxidoreductase subunit M [Flavobacteriales bacterium]|nr:NADH-quinone oxidoreductase subunit M [Flavobacteriales bacterium]
MITAALIAFPFLAALMLFLLPANAAKKGALVATLIQAAFTAYVIFLFDINEHRSLLSNEQFILSENWISTMGIRFFVGLDGLSMLMVILTNFLLPLIVLTTWNREFRNPRLFYFLMLMMQSALVGVFVSLDAFLYYIFWELALIPIYFIVLIWGGENRVKITFKFFIYTLLGSLLMLAAIIWLYLQTTDRSFGIDAFYALRLDPVAQRWIFWAFFIAYAIKIPLLPFHSWQPDTYTTAPNAGSMLLSGIMLKMGIYSIFRWILPITPMAVSSYTDVVLIMCVVGIIYASWIAIGQKDLKRLFAWSSIAHVGLITAGIFTLSRTGFQGAMIQMLAHGVNVVGLFFVAEIIQQRTGTNEIAKLGGIRQLAPVFASCFMVITFASVALPLTNGFIGEFLLLSSLYDYSYVFAAFAGLAVIFGAVYMLRAYKTSMLGENPAITVFADLTISEKLVLFPIVGLIVFFGLFPQFIFNLTDESVKYLLTEISNHMVPNL